MQEVPHATLGEKAGHLLKNGFGGLAKWGIGAAVVMGVALLPFSPIIAALGWVGLSHGFLATVLSTSTVGWAAAAGAALGVMKGVETLPQLDQEKQTIAVREHKLMTGQALVDARLERARAGGYSADMPIYSPGQSIPGMQQSAALGA